MKFVMTIANLHAADGGPQNAVLNIATELSQMGHETHVVALHAPNARRGPQFEEAKTAGVRIHEIEKRSHGPFRISPRLLAVLLRTSRRADLISAHGFYQFPCLAVPIAALVNRSPFVVQPHGVFEEYQEQRGSRFKPLFMRLIGATVLGRAESILVASDQEVLGVKALGAVRPEQIVKTGLGVRSLTPNTTGQRDYSTRTVIYIGRIAEKKRIDNLVHAAEILDSRNLRIRVLVCGSGDPHLTASLESEGRPVGVEFVGHVSGQARTLLEARAALFCLPSDNENFGQVVPEALAAGLPVVTTRQVGASSVVSAARAGWIIDKSDPELLAAAIQEALGDPDELRRRGERGQRYVSSELSWSKVARQWVTIAENAQRLPGQRTTENST